MTIKTISNICNNSKEDNVLIHSELLDNMWKDRASVLMNTIIDMLLFKRDKHKKVITVDLIHDSLMLQNIYNVWNNAKKAESIDSLDYLPPSIVKSLHDYLVSLPGFKEDEEFNKQPESIKEQHTYLYMELSKNIK